MAKSAVGDQIKPSESCRSRPKRPSKQQQSTAVKGEDPIRQKNDGTGRPTRGTRDKPNPGRRQRLDAGNLRRVEGKSKKLGSIRHWAERQEWPQEFFEPNRPNFMIAKDDMFPNRKMGTRLQYSVPSTTQTEITSKTSKNYPYRDARYDVLLRRAQIYLIEPGEQAGIMQNELLDEDLLEAPQPVPKNTLFSDQFFASTMAYIAERNEARIIQDIARLLVPSAEQLAISGATHLKVLVESVNEAWTNTRPLVGPRPQPDYAVGFKEGAFSESQHVRLSPFIGDVLENDRSNFMATRYMYFPFLSCETKSCAQDIGIADRQNMHSMTIAVRAVVMLFRQVDRQDEVNRKVLAFSISHNSRDVRIYGHYAICTEESTKYYRRLLHSSDLLLLNGREKWTAYRFTKNVYDIWMPAHFKRICSAIDQLPNPNDTLGTGEISGASGDEEDNQDIRSSDVPVEKQPLKKRRMGSRK